MAMNGGVGAGRDARAPRLAAVPVSGRPPGPRGPWLQGGSHVRGRRDRNAVLCLDLRPLLLFGSLVGAAIGRRVRRVVAGLVCGGVGALAGSIAAMALIASDLRTLPVAHGINGNGGYVGAPSLPTKVAVLFAGALVGAVFTSLLIDERPPDAGDAPGPARAEP
jgi:hypothetical protein